LFHFSDKLIGIMPTAAEAPTVTGRVYVQSQRLDEKRTLLDAVDNELRRIIGPRSARVSKAA
jgi:hypothetical protein